MDSKHRLDPHWVLFNEPFKMILCKEQFRVAIYSHTFKSVWQPHTTNQHHTQKHHHLQKSLTAIFSFFYWLTGLTQLTNQLINYNQLIVLSVCLLKQWMIRQTIFQDF